MSLTISQIIREVEAAARRFSYVRSVEKVDETRYAVKYRLTVNASIFVQLYFNVQNGTVGLVLVDGERRLYGRDADGGRWHRHPFDDPASHDESEEGSRPVSVAEFLAEVEDILLKENLL